MEGGLFEVVVEVIVPVFVTEKREVDHVVRRVQGGAASFERAVDKRRTKAALVKKGAELSRKDVFGR